MLSPEMDAKRTLRTQLLANRSRLTKEQLMDAAEHLCEHLRNLVHDARPTVVAAYVPFGSEPGGPALPGLLAGLAPVLLVPSLLPDKDLDWYRYGNDETLGPEAISVAVLIITPALAVDVSGWRLGRGGGSYDRALARAGSGALLAALLHEGEILPHVPHEPHDRRVRLALTPTGITKLDR